LNSVEVLGVRVSCIDKNGILDIVKDWANASLPRTILYVNAHCLNNASTDPEYRSILNQADLVYADGIGVVYAGRLINHRSLQKITGRDWIWDYCMMAEAISISMYILASRPGVAQKAAGILLQKQPKLNILGVTDGYFVNKKEQDILKDISLKKPQVVFVGMGTPSQEKWIWKHRSEIAAPVCWSVGALFDYVGGIEPPVPNWLNSLALEWFWRLLMDPIGKWKRYLLGNPLFVMRALKEKYKNRSS
jgi:N-acetylglucosaminyldiphosphoundecaprenol N-acetyl-beta-D-mannosaminyltransferase